MIEVAVRQEASGPRALALKGANGRPVRFYGAYTFQARQLERIAEFGITRIQRRAQAGIGSDDAPMPELSRGYARRKARTGRTALRDLTFTGAMLNNLTVRSVSDSEVRMAITSTIERRKALANERLAPWFGWSPADVTALARFSGQIFTQGSTGSLRDQVANQSLLRRVA